ncbi:glycine-rich domain-containing protein, partial [Pseudomonas aeruginosa]|uniref:glycine-rich domain-containing protein n=1 Tax=Pseudomonas aeruginosa TaxID=287 RepID=UPI001B83781A
MALLGITLLAGAAFVGGYLYRRGLDRRRYRFIQQFRLPPRVAQAVRERYPQLSEEQVQRVLGGLREYLLLCRAAGKRMVAMPSQVVDVAWHELILHTRLYQHVCRKGLGRFLHHTPAQAMRSPRQAQEGIRRAWKLACRREGIDPQNPTRLPLLFALDTELAIADGFRYTLNCAQRQDGGAAVYCASHIGCSSGCASDSGSTFGSDGQDSRHGCRRPHRYRRRSRGANP